MKLEAAALVAALSGAWDNAAQFEAAPAALKVPPSVQGEWLDMQHARFARIDAPAIGTQVLYLEWRSGGPQGPVSRQRIWSFRHEADGALRMDFYAFIDGKPWAGRALEPGVFAELKAADLRGYGPACALRFEQAKPTAAIRGEVRGDYCTITAASGRRMAIDASVELKSDGSLHYRESGRLEDGRFAFRVPPTTPYEFTRR